MERSNKNRTIQNTAEEFLMWLQVERRFAPSSVVKYRSILKCFVRDVGNVEIDRFTMEHIFELKKILYERQNSEVFIGVTLACIKGLLKYCRNQRSAPLRLNPDEITIPKRPRREVVFLTSEEIQRFKESIDIKPIYGLRFRTLVEVLLASGMRISEALSLNRDSIDYVQREAKIIGKGNKERAVFFSEEAMGWIQKYLSARLDKNKAMFITTGKKPRRLRNQDLTRYFKRQRMIAGINKKVTPHCLRHCFASHLAFNNCPFTEIKTLLGHERLDTTIRYYVGLGDKEKAKVAHQKYLRY
ncbi:MAG TPA: tyrosine-type recombinase/integrase [Candidatus Bathyarchaeia archaeon]|nr:tyrosine-type recombinase/integrase [Candidatus Bathyarchaeia archaeon]